MKISISVGANINFVLIREDGYSGREIRKETNKQIVVKICVLEKSAVSCLTKELS